MTEMKLTKDVLTGANDGLMHEKKHLTTELKETRVLYRTYETKCTSIMNELNAINSEYQELKRNTISHDETNKVKDGQINTLRAEQKDL
jgi:chromosome segregation ATPase